MRREATSGRAELAIRIRRARPDERLELERIQRRAALANPEYRLQLEEHPDALELGAAEFGRGTTLVADREGGPCGFALMLFDGPGAELDGLFVDPPFWGQGIGRRLVEHAVHEARRLGLSLTVTSGPRSVEFYRSCGFAVEGETGTRFGPAFRMSR